MTRAQELEKLSYRAAVTVAGRLCTNPKIGANGRVLYRFYDGSYLLVDNHTKETWADNLVKIAYNRISDTYSVISLVDRTFRPVKGVSRSFALQIAELWINHYLNCAV